MLTLFIRENKNEDTLDMAKDLISLIDGKRIHDASAIHKVIPNVSDFSVQVGEAGSAYGSQMKVGMPSDYENMLENLTPNLILKDTSVITDIDVYNKVEIDDQMDVVRSRQSLVESGVGDVPEYDPYNTYEYDQLMKKDGIYYRCIVPQTQGVWNPAEWAKTSLFDEISEIRGTQPNIEKVTVQVTVSRGDGIVAGTQISLIYDSTTGKPTQTVTLDSTGIATFFINHGDTYYIAASGIIGYITPESPVYTAELPRRSIYLVYRVHASAGVFIIDENGFETPYEDWDENRTDGRYVRLINSTLCPGPESDNSIVISRYWSNYAIQDKWQIETKNLPNLPNIASGQDNDFNGKWNCSTAISDCTTPNEEGKTFIDLYNESKGTNIGIIEYLPAIAWCHNKTETILGQTYLGYLPSTGQLKQIYNNINDVNDALNKIGATPLSSFNSDRWWSSTEYSANDSWYLYNGASDYHYFHKNTNSFRILVLFPI